MVRAADRDRYLLALAGIDPKVVTPEDRAMRRAVDLCGRIHAGRRGTALERYVSDTHNTTEARAIIAAARR